MSEQLPSKQVVDWLANLAGHMRNALNDPTGGGLLVIRPQDAQYLQEAVNVLERRSDETPAVAALNAIRAKLAEYLERLLQGRTLPNRWVGEINDIVSAALAEQPAQKASEVPGGAGCPGL